ncbi:hypothetical protein BH10ACT10_BH10ACT10_02180 [soil metagenome]
MLGSSLIDAFTVRAAAQPERPAVIGETESRSYAELDRESSQLARILCASGVRPGDLVGLLMGRTPQVVTSILAILKAGAAYVPLDPDYPVDRLRYIAEDSGVVCVLGDPTRAAACGLDDLRVIPADTAACVDNPGETPPPVVPPEAGAYVIYTSGSTGEPKGCVISHANVMSLMDATLPLLDLGPEDVWTMFHSFAFDFSVWEVWGALLTGAAVVVVPVEIARSPERFLGLLDQHAVTVLSQVPSVFRRLTAAAAAASTRLPRLRYVVLGGEAVDLDTVRRFRGSGIGTATVINMYGITETTVHATVKVLDDEALAGDVRSPIGRPLAHLRIELRDADGALVNDGEVGEMFVAGEGVAAGGYLHRPELTAERFTDGWYRSGDLARRLPDGELEFVGRNDNQVKRWGFRIELGEIEAALRTLSGVTDAAVSLRDDQLTAYVVTDSGTGGLRAACVSTLPAHMVPDRYVAVPRLPMTASGKLDRLALDESVSTTAGQALGTDAGSAGAADGTSAADRVTPPPPNAVGVLAPNRGPRNVVEARLADIWEELLGVARVQPGSDFFDLGGDSLAMVALLARVREDFGIDIDFTSFFVEPTLAGLAQRIRSEEPASEARVVRVAGPPVGRPFFCVHPANGRVLFLRTLRRGTFEQAIHGIRALGLAPGEEPLLTVEEMAADYVAQIRAVAPTGPYLLGGYCVGGFIAYEMAQQLSAMGEEVELVVIFDTQIDLAEVEPTVESARAARLAEWRRMLPANERESPGGVSDSWEEVLADAQRLGALPADLTVDDLIRNEDVMFHTLSAAHSYVTRMRPYAGRVSYLAAVDDESQPTPHSGWERHVDQLSYERVVADHYEVFTKPETAQILARILDNPSRH